MMLQPRSKFCLINVLSLLIGCVSVISADALPSPVLKQIDVAPVWSVHRCGSPELLTHEGRQYVAYYDADRYLTIAQRQLGSDEWKFHRFPVQMKWATGSHAKLSMALDREGYIHLSCYRRHLTEAPKPPPTALYYRSSAPHSIDAFEHLYMISPEEHPHYPTYYTVDDRLFFAYRDGGSGRGDQRLNRYDAERRVWVRAFDTPLIDGQGERSAYVFNSGMPVPGPDGRFHLLWVWRETPDHATNHSLSYARTVGNNLDQWESAGGVPVTPPFTIEDRELLVDGSPPGGGMSNVFRTLNWDSKGRPVISYHKFDEDGFSQIYNARFEGGEWRIVAATDWNFVWGDAYKGRGALGIYEHVRMDKVEPGEEGELNQYVWNRDDGGQVVVLDEETLSPIRVEDPQPAPEWRQKLAKPESDFQVEPIPDLRREGGPMEVHLIREKNTQKHGVEYYLRWEHAGTNRDRPIPKPWPEPSMLRLYQVQNH